MLRSSNTASITMSAFSKFCKWPIKITKKKFLIRKLQRADCSPIFKIDSLSYIISIIHYNLPKTEWVEAIHVRKSLMMLATTNVLHMINLNNKFHFLWNWSIENITILYKAHDCIALVEPDGPCMASFPLEDKEILSAHGHLNL